MSDTIRILLAKAPGSVTFTSETAKRMVGQRIHVTPGDPATAGTIVAAWVQDEYPTADRGKEIHAHVKIGTDAPEPIKQVLKEPTQPNIEGWDAATE